MKRALTPIDPEYYAKPKSWRDRYNLRKHGWKKLSNEKEREYLERMKNVNPILYEIITQNDLKGASLRWYKGRGICLFLEEIGTPFELEGGKESEGISLEDLRNFCKKRQFIGRNI